MIHKALNGLSKSTSAEDILGLDIEINRKRIQVQMTPEINWSNVEINHVKPIPSIEVSKDEELRKTFNWINTQPFIKKQLISRKELNFF